MPPCRIQITEWHSQNEAVQKADSDADPDVGYVPQEKSLVIYIFGKKSTGESVSVIARDFPCFFYLRLPTTWYVKGAKSRVIRDRNFAKEIVRNLNTVDMAAFISSELCWRRNFRGFNNNEKLPFLRLNFRNSHAMRNCANIFVYENTINGIVNACSGRNGITKISTDKVKGVKDGSLLQFMNKDQTLYEIVRIEGLDLYIRGEPEVDLSSPLKWILTKGDGSTRIRKPITNKVLRVKFPGIFQYDTRDNQYETTELYEATVDPMLRFLHIKNITPCGWIEIPGESLCDMTEDPDSAKTTSRYEADVDWKMIQVVESTETLPIRTLAYDIECTSSHGDFPQAKKNYTKLAKDLLELPIQKATTQYLQKALEKIPYGDSGPIHRVYPKTTVGWTVSPSLCVELVQYLWLNWAANKARLTGPFTLTYSVLAEALCISVEESGEEILDLLEHLCESIPTLAIRPKEGFCGWATTSVDKQEYTIVYTDRRVASGYIEISLTALLGSHLPALHADACIQIGVCYHMQGHAESYRKIMYALDTCDSFAEDVEVKDYPNSLEGERQLLLDFVKDLLEEDPDIITGYNTFSFDWPYLFDRAEELGIEEEFTCISRLRNKQCFMTETSSKGARGKYVDIPGRVNLDLYKVIQRDYNLQSYKLDNVSAHFIRGRIKRVEAQDGPKTKIFTDNTIGVKPGNYVQFIQTSAYDEDKMEGGSKFIISSVENDHLIVDGVPTELIKKCESGAINANWALGKDDVTPQDIFECQRGSSADRAKVAKYCIMDVVLCLELMNKLQILTNNVGMANVCTTPLSWIIKRGQGIKILSLVAKQCRLQNYLLPTLFSDTYGDDSYEGAIVLKPYPKIYLDDEPVSVLDYASLYPNSMISENLSHETLVTDERWLGDKGKARLNKLGYPCVDITYDNYVGAKDKKVNTGKITVRFVSPRTSGKGVGKVGIIPTILIWLVTARKRTRKKILYKAFTLKDGTEHVGLSTGVDDGQQKVLDVETKVTTTFPVDDVVDERDYYTAFEKAVLDGLQLAYKVTANSLYGQIGARTSFVYWKDIAAATTATGRAQLYIAKDYIEENYEGSKIVYGDTDSVFVTFKMLGTDGKPLRGKDAIRESIRLGKEAGIRISKILKKPQDLEYEKTFMPFILLSKKRYVGDKYEDDADNFKQISMGIVLKRRDNAPILKLIYGGVINLIMSQKKIAPAIDFLQKSLRQFVTGKYGMDKLIITKTLNDGYKNPEMIAHKVLADRIAERDPGNKPQLYDRIPYVYIQTAGKVTLQGDRIESPDYIRKNRLKPDYHFYVTNQIMKPISQIFALCITDIPSFRHTSDYYDRVADKHRRAGLKPETIEKKLTLQKQRDASELLFWDIMLICDAQKNGTQSITKWCT